MTDIALKYVGQTGDIDLTGHRLNLATGEAAIEQQVNVRLRFFYEEWFLDRSQGIPYFRDVLIKSPNITAVTYIFRQAILTTPGISAVNSINVKIDSATRMLEVDNLSATTDTGAALDFSPFVIEI